MFLSYLLVDTAADPAHPRPGRSWVRNVYRVHQRLCMAFPSAGRKNTDPQFLAPFAPDDFGIVQTSREALPDRCVPYRTQHVHAPRDGIANFLFRIDAIASPLRARYQQTDEWRPGEPVSMPSRHVIVVQSGIEPDWEYAFHNAREFLCAKPLVKDSEPRFTVGQKLRFLLRANPTKRLTAKSVDAVGKLIEKWHDKKGKGRRVGLYTTEQQEMWLRQQGEGNEGREGKGFRILDVCTESEGNTRTRKGECDLALFAVRFDGLLEVTDPDRFHQAILSGIGAGKGFGFGLLSVAPA